MLIDLRGLKQGLEFAAKLERTAPTKATADEAAAVMKVQNAQTISSAEYLAGEIKKNKLAALAALLVLTVGIVALYYFTRGNGSNQQTIGAPIDSIAVLPFENAAQDQNAEYLSDGITESLINRLSLLSKLKVMSSSSVFRYKGREMDPQVVGRELGVRAVLKGSVTQRGDSLRINAELLDVMRHTLALPHDACRESALHGLGHWHRASPAETADIIDGFLARNEGIRDELRRYALAARCGCIQ